METIMSLSEAIAQCKKEGGTMRSWGQESGCRYDIERDVMIDPQGNTMPGYTHTDVVTQWIYEPPKESAFNKWNRSFAIDEIDLASRKEGWNAAINAGLQTGIIAPSVEYVKPWFDKIRKLRED